MGDIGDIIEGKVIGAVDGDVFIIEVTALGQGNKDKYENIERIDILGSESIELYGGVGVRTKEELEEKLKGKIVKCFIDSRDHKGRLKAHVSVV